MWNKSKRPCTHDEAKANPGMYSWCPECGDPIEAEAVESATRATYSIEAAAERKSEVEQQRRERAALEAEQQRRERAALEAEQQRRERAALEAHEQRQQPFDVSQLKELKELLDAGALTEDEFSEAKARLLYSAPAPSEPAAAVTASPTPTPLPNDAPAPQQPEAAQLAQQQFEAAKRELELAGNTGSSPEMGCLKVSFWIFAMFSACIIGVDNCGSSGSSSSSTTRSSSGSCWMECNRGYERCEERPNHMHPDPNYCGRILDLCRDSCDR